MAPEPDGHAPCLPARQERLDLRDRLLAAPGVPYRVIHVLREAGLLVITADGGVRPLADALVQLGETREPVEA